MKPLADKIRPNTLDNIIGQKHLIGEGKIISNLVKNKKLFSMILFGPPGTGKTTLAYTLINELSLEYAFLNAVINSKKDFDEVTKIAKTKENFVLIMDEIHRLNKDKQDLLLPYLENGIITLIGMTTANPYHSINPAIRSRCQLFELKSLKEEDILEALKKVLTEFKDIKIDNEALSYIAQLLIKKINNKPNLYFDKNEDGYYDTISAFQKSIRGSDVQAALHYLAKLIAAEDMDIITRRLSVIAYEDIGLANPSIGPRVNAAINAAERLGFPEARIPLAEIVIDMTLSPKSNTAEMAIDRALSDINKGNTGKVPKHLKNGSRDYKYPHSYKGNFVKQQYLPDELVGKKYYIPKNSSKYETGLANVLAKIEKMQ